MAGRPTYEELYSHIVAKAAKDDGFRRKLIAQPNATVAKELSAAFPGLGPMPKNLNVHVVEQPKDSIVILLPPPEVDGPEELSDTELEVVAGGYPSPTCGGNSCAVATQGNVC